MFRNILIFLALTIPSCMSAFTQNPENTGPPKDTAVVIKEYLINPLTRQADSIAFDTTMQEFFIYNPIYKYSFSNSFLGNSGQASQSNDFSLRNTFSPFIFEKPYRAYFHDPYNTSHYNTRKPFTQIEYITFGKSDISEQVIKALHTQNLNPNTNFGFLYDVIASKGIYLNQNTKSNRFTFFGSYDKNAYSVYGSININKVTQAENGGLIDISLFEKHEAKEPKNYSMFFDNSDNEKSKAESKVRKNVFFITQTFDIQKEIEDTSKVKRKEPTLFNINHTLSYSKYYKLYWDYIQPSDTLNFYSNIYYPVNIANDSASSQIIENSLQISGDSYKFLPGFIAGIKHQYQVFGKKYPYQPQITATYLNQSELVIKNILIDTILTSSGSVSYNNLSVFGSILDKSKQRIEYEGFVEYFFSGFRQNDLMAKFNWKYFSKNNNSSLIASANFYLTEPDFFMKNYSSSHFRWDNSFKKVNNTEAKLAFSLKNGTFNASAGVNLIGNYVYFNQDALPEAADKAFLVSSIHLLKKFRWKGFNQINRVMVQKSGNEEILQLPLLAYGNISYYEKALFKNALKFQIGFDLYYNTSYYADAFMPATGTFYRQDKKKVGNYPFVDAFLNWKLKRTRFFIKYTNSLSGFAGYNYFTTYGYPMNERGLRYGLSWTFYD